MLAWLSFFSLQVSSEKRKGSVPDKRSVHDSCHDTDCDGLLLGCLATGGSAPTENERVDAVGTDGENDHGDVAARNTDFSAGESETESGYGFGDGDVPGSLVELARRPRHGDCDGAGNEVGRAGQDEGDGRAEAEGLDNGGKEVLETYCQSQYIVLFTFPKIHV